MRPGLKGIYEAFRREIRMIIGDSDLITIILLSPLFYAFFYGSVYLNKTENSVPVAIVDMDKSQMSKSFARSLDSHQLIDISAVVNDYTSAVDRMYSLDVQGIILIPQGFSSQLKQGSGANLKVYLNTSRFLISNDINKAVTEVALTYNAFVRLKYFQTQGYNFEQARELIEPLKGEVKPLFNPTESYGDFMIPGLLVLIIQQTLLIGLAESIAKEREKGTLKDLYETAGRSIWAVLSGKGAFYFILFASYAFMFYVVHFSVFNISFKGSASAVMTLTAVFLISIISMCIFIASFFRRKIISLQVFAFTSYPFFLISGYPWPLQSMPPFFRAMAQILPSTPYLNAFGRITQMGAGWTEVMPEFIHLLLLAFVGLVAAKLRIGSLLKSEAQKNGTTEQTA